MLSDIQFVLNLSVLLMAAFIGGLLARRFGYPAALGELIVGIAIGPYALGLAGHSDVVFVLAQLGGILLLFYIGLQTDPKHLSTYLRPSMVAGVSGALLPFSLGYVGMLCLGYSQTESSFMGAVLTATSLGITMRVLSDMDLQQTVVGHIVLGAGVIDDVVAVTTLSAVLGFLSGTFTPLGLGSIVATAVAFWILVFFIGTKFLCKLLDRSSLGLESLILLLMPACFVSAFISGTIGISPIIGAFAIGVSLSRMKDIDRVLEGLNPLYLFFVPIFFVSVGMLIDLRAFSVSIVPGIVMTLLAIIGKIIGCGGSLILVKYPRKTALKVGVAMIPRGEMGLVIASMGLASAYIGNEVYAIAIMVVALTTIAALPILKNM